MDVLTLIVLCVAWSALLVTFFVVLRRHTRVQTFFEELPSAVVVVDAGGRITSANRRAIRLLGIENVGHRPSLAATAMGKTIVEKAGGGNVAFSLNNLEREWRIDGRVLTGPDGGVSGRLYVITDITGDRRSEEEERRSDRLEAAGSLAAGIAHEVKNPLSSLAVNLQLLDEHLVSSPNPQKVRHYLNVIQSEVRRLNAIVDNFIDFSRPNVMTPSPASVDAILESIVTLVTPECDRQKVAVAKSPVAGTPVNVPLDASQITRALLNIVINAIQSMPVGGTLTYGVEYSEDYVVVRVTDTGGGISPEAMDKIFDLFYTTKKGGSGLGLSLAQKIVSAHRGYINVRNTGEGACFTVGLPLQRTAQPWASTTNTGS